MRKPAVDTPDLGAATVRSKTGKDLNAWFDELDAAGGRKLGRRDRAQWLLERLDKDAWWATTIAVEYERVRGMVEKDGRPTGYAICSTKTIAAELPAVFEAFGKSEGLARWLGAGARADFTDGGEWNCGDGDRARFLRIRPNKDLRLAWEGRAAPGSAVEVLFADKGKGKTGITLNHTRIDSRADADLLRAAWSEALDALKQALES